VSPVALGLDGNAITLSRPLYEAVVQETGIASPDPRATAHGLAKVIGKRQAVGAPPLTLAHVFPFSSHHYQLRLWLAAGGIDPDKDLRLTVIPPPFMVRSLTNGEIDGFCVGAPWNAVAVQAGVGQILHRGRDIVQNCPEKLLAFRADFAAANPESVAALATAIRQAADWCSDPSNLDDLTELLAQAARSQEEWSQITPKLLRNILAPTPGAAINGASLRLDREATRIRKAHALWLYRQMVDAHQVSDLPEYEATASSVYRPDLGLEPPMGDADSQGLRLFPRSDS